MRFDMRAPATGAPRSDLYGAALEMAAWAESRGCVGAVLCEHHASEDGYLPSPMMLASAMAARTTTLPITIAAIVLPLYDPVRLAEEMAVLDIISNGRVSYVAAIGYRPVEYEMHGVDFHDGAASPRRSSLSSLRRRQANRSSTTAVASTSRPCR